MTPIGRDQLPQDARARGVYEHQRGEVEPDDMAVVAIGGDRLLNCGADFVGPRLKQLAFELQRDRCGVVRGDAGNSQHDT